MRVRAAFGFAFVVAVALSGCEAGDPRAASAVADPPPPAPGEVFTTPSPASAELADYYARVQNGLLTQGLMRTDGGGVDAPFGARELVRNFIRIALFEEYSDVGGRLVAREKPSRVHRWEKPVTLSIEFGASVPQADQTRDRHETARLLARLSRATGHAISQVPAGQGNFRVFVVNEEERRALGPELRRIMPNISSTALNTVINLPRTTYCLAFATDPEGDGTYNQAIAVVRAEHPDLLRASCLHEEISQGMGLSNDYPLARPSIFNDDEEFAFLTRHDELLLEMLYDKRLRPGMSESEARPIVERIARELMGGEA
jgi:hypothetical protein